MVFAALSFNITARLTRSFGLPGGDDMKNESDKTDRTFGDEVEEEDGICEACCCFVIEACEMLHSQGCKVDTTCCW